MAPRLAPTRQRSLAELALENAVEGCTREAFGAVVAGHQAGAAATPEMRAALATIADEEMGHAELSWAIHEWALTRLDETEAAAIEAARLAAVASVAAGDYATEPAEVRAAVGLPDAATGRALARDFATALA
jgi:hypothetical protein